MTDPRVEREAIALFEAMLDTPEPERDAWIAARTHGRPDLLARLAAMRAADRLADLRTGGAVDLLDLAAPPERIGAYRIVELIGRGGMGSVYRAERAAGDFAHVVAIKIIKPGLLAESLVARFQRERQTLAQLSHPHIARLYDGGELADGAPYIVMEHVDGSPLLEWVDTHNAPGERRRALFLQICDAVAAAHRALIVHRDLTPSNVLVTREGAIKLIDFGIAKFAESDHLDASPPSAGIGTAELSLTPGYAAPERLTGAPVTTAADVYSLGKLLEKLFRPDAAPPRADKELRAIIRRATAPLPQDRYPSVDALAHDVAAWRDRRPVDAMDGGKRYRFGKFVSRHRTAVAAAGVTLALLAAAFGRAETARVDAERRFEETRAIAKTLLFDTYDEVSRAPGSTRARALLAQKGLAYLESLAASNNAPADVKIEAGLGYLRLAQVTGGGQAAQLGRYRDANALLARSNAILAALVRDAPANPAARLALGRLRVEQSRVALYNDNDARDALAKARDAQALIGAKRAADPVAAAAFAEAVLSEGDSRLWTNQFALAEAILLRCEAFIAALPPAIRDDGRVMRVRASNQRLLGEALHNLKRPDPARAAIDRGVAIAGTLEARTPDDPAAKRQLVSQLRYQAIVHRTNRRDAEARVSIDRALDHAKRLRDRDPADAGAVQLFAAVAEVAAQMLADARQYRESYALSDQVIASFTRLVALSDGAAGARRSLAAAYATRGGNFYNGGAYPQACASWREASAIFADLDRQKTLNETDRNKAVAELQEFLTKACDPPRAGLKPHL